LKKPTDKRSVLAIEAEGAVGYIVKPISAGALSQAVTQTLRGQ
jgi:DNA-binding NarL/FixJ family response regulator